MKSRIAARRVLFISLLLIPAITRADLVGGPYVIGPLDVNGGGAHSTSADYAIVASTGQYGGVGVLSSADYQLDDGFHRPALSPDCNNNGVADEEDILLGTSFDCNDNQIPDDCESEEDCNSDTIADICQLVDNDCNVNGIPDDCEEDCNLNGTPDGCDVDPADPDGDELVSLDCDNDLVPDECELSGNDCNNDLIPDNCQLVDNDCNVNGIPDECELQSACADVLSVWTGIGGDNQWSNSANWCPPMVPFNGNMDFDYSVEIGPGATIEIDDGLTDDVTICSLDLDPTSTVNAASSVGRTLTIETPNGLDTAGSIMIQNNSNGVQAEGQINNDGCISIIATQGTADFVPAALGTTLSSGAQTGEVRLFNPGTSRLGSLSGTVSLTNDIGHLVCGAGDVLGTFTNDGAVIADVPNNALTLRGVGTSRTNNSKIAATNGGELRIGGVMNQGVGGVIEASDGTVNLGDGGLETAIVDGGTLRQTTGQLRLGNLSRLRDVTIEGTLTVPSLQNSGFIEGLIVNSGVILLDPSDGPDLSTITTNDIDGNGDAELSGAGRLQLLISTESILTSAASEFPILTNGPNHTIEGVGIVEARLINDGIVSADPDVGIFGDTLSIDPTGGLELKVNNGTMAATNFANLELNAVLTNNGLITATASGTVNINVEAMGSGSYLADEGTINILADVTEVPPASGFSMVAHGGTINLATGNTVDGCGPIIVFPKGGGTNSSAEVELDNATIMNSSLWEIGDEQTGTNLTASITLMNDSDGFVNGPVTVHQNGALSIDNSNLTAVDLILKDGATLMVGSSITLGGSLIHDLTLDGSTIWAWDPLSTLTLAGGQAPTAGPCTLEGWATIEAASEDLGIGTGNDFQFADLIVSAGSHVSIVDNATNHSPAVTEAIYCDTLSLGADAVLNLNGLNLYVGGVLVTPGPSDAGVIENTLRIPIIGDVNMDGVSDISDTAGFVDVLLGSNADPSAICAADLNGDGLVDGLDIQILVMTLTGQ